METGIQFKFGTEWDHILSDSSAILNEVLPSAEAEAVVGLDVNLSNTLKLTTDNIVDYWHDSNGNSECFTTQETSAVAESIAPTHPSSKMSAGFFPSKSPWHESDSGVSSVSDTISFAGSPLGSVEDLAVDPQLIFPMHQAPNIEADDFAAYLLGESHPDPSTDFIDDCVRGEHKDKSYTTTVFSETGRPLRKCITNKLDVVDENSDTESEDETMTKSLQTNQIKNESRELENGLNFFQNPRFRSKGDIKIVKVLKQPSCSPNATTDEIIKALDERSKKNAQQARLNREKKKSYIQSLEKEIDGFKKENQSLKNKNNQMRNEMSDLEEEVYYLKNVLANASALSGLLKNINNVKEVKLSANIRGRKRSLDGDHSYTLAESQSNKRSRLINENLKKAGVCLHVNDGEASLEFCARCSSLANKTHGRGDVSSKKDS